ncbi:LysM peptidoglycan-binding domain-containing protein (plasmid) [Streptomyces canus]|uniref:LysM peptidoglycan-binding domain-containing protein n=1 Tax=Streptomyces canus TaxID=58343 RepID=UPI00386A7F46|nr:LysM peptidoglycan-binding domain-containing protein [Streptomyces canus]
MPTAPSQPQQKMCVSHTIVGGDTLSAIAAKYLGGPNRWTEIYDTNESSIEAAARKHSSPPVFGRSDHGHWIFPGARLTIPMDASCAPTNSAADATDNGGVIKDQHVCEKAGRPWVKTKSGGFCGDFGLISVPAHPFSQEELNELLIAEDAVGCLKDVASIAAGIPAALSRVGKKVVLTVLYGDKIVTVVRDVSSGNQDKIVWATVEMQAEARGARGVECFKLAYDGTAR